jgi:heme-degrading monooxygenase HmoA
MNNQGKDESFKVVEFNGVLLLTTITAIRVVINVGFYYRVKKGHEKEFEETFMKVLEHLKANVPGFKDAKLYRSVTDPQEYLIYSEWESLEVFRNFISSNAYRETVNYGRTILEGRPMHKVLQQIE